VNQGADLRFEGPGEVLRRRISLLIGALVLFALSVALRDAGAPGWGVLVEQTLAICLLVSFSLNRYRAIRRGILHASAGGLQQDGVTVVERSRVAAAFLLSPEDSVVRIILRRALPVDVRLESEEKARALLTALGLGTGHVATFEARYGGRRRPLAGAVAAVAAAGALGASSALLHGGGMASAARLVLLWAAALSFYLRSFVRVDVGSDGVLLRRVGEQRFLSYNSIVGASVDERGAVVLTMRSEGEIRLSMATSPDKVQLRDTFLERIEDGRTAFARERRAEGAEALIAPGRRSVSLWMKDVRALAGPLHYRETRLDQDRLWQVVDDATASPATRAGAALAIAVHDQPSRLRLRVAAEACAQPKLRVALTRVSEGASDPELEEVLAPLLESRPMSSRSKG
jgi:hypothetical protein